MITFMIYLNIRKMIVFVSLMKLRQDAILLSCEVHAAESWQTNLDKDWFRVFPTAVQPSWEFIPCLLIPHCHDFDRQISQEVLHLLAHWEGFKPTSPKMAGIKRTCFFMFFQVAPCEQLARWSWRRTSLGPAWVSAMKFTQTRHQQVWNFNALHLTCLMQFLVWSILWMTLNLLVYKSGHSNGSEIDVCCCGAFGPDIPGTTMKNLHQLSWMNTKLNLS